MFRLRITLKKMLTPQLCLFCQTLKETIQDLRRLYTEPPTTPAEPLYLQPDDDAPPASTHVYETIGGETVSHMYCLKPTKSEENTKFSIFSYLHKLLP